MERDFKYIFGPVISRRLGVSLGVDLMPYKTCSLDCVYCECGATTDLVSEIAEYVPTEDVMNELEAYLSSSPNLDCVTFSGAGEPTLHSGLGLIINFIKKRFDQYKIAVITNGTLIHKNSVRDALSEADIVMTSLDALEEDVFSLINRPHPDIRIEDMKNGLVELKKTFKGKLWVEFFVIPAINDKKDHLDKLRDFICLIEPDKIQLNSLDRPGTEGWVRQADAERLSFISSYLENSEIIKNHEIIKAGSLGFIDDLPGRVLNTISRRPCTIEDLSNITGESMQRVEMIVKTFVSEGLVKSDIMARGVFFSLV